MFLLILAILNSQINLTKGLKENPPSFFAIKNVKIIVNSEKIIENGTIVIREGRIENVGKNIKIPEEAYVLDYSGKWVYPGFIESYFVYKEKKEEKELSKEEKINSDKNIIDIISFDEKIIRKYRENGFTSILFLPGEGIFKGKSALFSLREGKIEEKLIKRDVFQHVEFDYYKDRKGYPNSFMGAISVVRQTFYDAIWHRKIWDYYKKNKNIPKPIYSKSLVSLYDVLEKKQKIVFEIEDDIDIYRVLKIKKEFDLDVVIKGSSYEYRQIDILKKEKLPIIIPLNFPQFDFENPEEAIDVSLEELIHWEYAPFNPKKLWENGIEFSFTTYGTKDLNEFFRNLKEAIKRGLPQSYALKALTENPAKLIGVYDIIGSIEKGKLAHFIITDGNIFEEGKIYEVWIEDKVYKIKEEPLIKPQGKWEITLYLPEKELKGNLEIKGDFDRLIGEILFENEKITLKKINISLKHIDITFDSQKIGYPGVIFLSGVIENKTLKGKGILPDGKEFEFNAILKEAIEREERKKQIEVYKEPELLSPPSEFGIKFPLKEYKSILIKNGTIWTSSQKGILKEYDILIKDGKFYKIGKNLKEKVDLIIDATGKHITPGIVDPHSHIAIKGENNETGDIVTSEVRIEDVLDPYDISIYRLLAGGVTVSNVLHGSANSIGGQNIVIKHKWGVKNPEELIFKKAIPTLKFALGENPVGGDYERERFPQTRMGVEEIIRNKFKEAIDYKLEKENSKYPLRKNLEIEPILEVIENKRMPYVHAYRADEMITFLNLLKEFGIKKVSFQHALEAYKIIDKLKEFNAYVTVFSDLWAYKFEAYDGIPYNASMLFKNGIIVSLHSDFSEIARRLNTEAAKTMKYGDLKEEDALKLITIYPAIQLGIDKFVGSIEEGKDADFVIWDGNPLSTYSKVLETWIEGKKYFDREEDLRMRERGEKERFRIIQKYLMERKERKMEGERP